jgi:hypothetical protein
MPVEEVLDTTKNEVKKPLFVSSKEAQSLTGIKILYWGEFGTGKTYDACTFPGPIHILSTEFGCAPIVSQTGREDIFRLECTDPFTEKPKRANGEEDDEPFATDPVESLNKVEEATEWLYQAYKNGDIKGGTVIIDSISDIWAWLANWLDYIAKKQQSKSSGKEYMMRTEWQKANAKYKWILMRLLALPCNLVMTARSSPVYDGQGNVTASSKPKAQGETSYYVDVVAHLTNEVVNDVGQDGKVSGSKIVRACTIEKCRLGDVPGDLHMKDGTYESLKEALSDFVPKGTFL